MLKNSFYKDVAKAVVAMIVVMTLCRFTMGGMAVVVALTGLVAALMRKYVVVVSCFILFPLLVIFNRAIIGLTGITLLIARFAFIAMAISAFLSGTVGNNTKIERPPLGWITLYLFIACLSSIGGWMPMISYLKILNFIVMLFGIYLLAKQMQYSVECLQTLRVIFMAMSIIMIVGSLFAYFVPSIGFSMMLYRLEGFGIYTTGDEVMTGQSLFNGLTCHSQMLSPVVSCLATWVLCDMLLIERRLTILHGGILACVPILLYLSRSRGGLLMLVCVVITSIFVTLPRARLSKMTKRQLGVAISVGAVILILAGIYYQVKNDAISRWLRKTDDVANDTRTLDEAFTGSRQALIEMNMRDFRLNPLIGKGFQVVEGMDQSYDAGLITWYSASVEKGVTPFVILGETGLLGAIAFLIFLCSFYYVCLKREYMSLLTNFTCFLVANLADSTFFSPSGLGGFMWMVACVGAFSTDCLSKRLYLMHQDGECKAPPWGR